MYTKTLVQLPYFTVSWKASERHTKIRELSVLEIIKYERFNVRIEQDVR